MYNFFSHNRLPEDYVHFFYLIEFGFSKKKKKKKYRCENYDV